MRYWKQGSRRARFLIIAFGLMVFTGGLYMLAQSGGGDPAAE